MWEFRINWRERKKKHGSGGSLLGLYGFFEARRIAKKLRKQYPERLFWISSTKSIPTTRRNGVKQ